MGGTRRHRAGRKDEPLQQRFGAHGTNCGAKARKSSSTTSLVCFARRWGADGAQNPPSKSGCVFEPEAGPPPPRQEQLAAMMMLKSATSVMAYSYSYRFLPEVPTLCLHTGYVPPYTRQSFKTYSAQCSKSRQMPVHFGKYGSGM